MKIKKSILSMILAVSVLAGGSAVLSGCAKPDDDSVIVSDGTGYPVTVIDDVTIPAAAIANNTLPAVGNHETLLKLLNERGAIYEPGQRDTIWSRLRSTFNKTEDIALNKAMISAPQADVAGTGAAPAGIDTGGTFSETNEQVEGVSEGDIVKTDGEYIYSMPSYGGKLYIVKAGREQLKTVSAIQFDGINVTEFYLVGNDRLVVVGNEYREIQPVPYDDADAKPESDAKIYYDDYYMPYSRGFTVAAVYDISDKTAPSEVRRVSMDGFSVATRITGGTLYMVTGKHIWAIPRNAADSELILPYVCDTADGKDYLPLAYDRIYIVPETENTSYLIIGALDIYGDKAFEPEAYFGAGSNLYMSRDAIYVASSRREQRGGTVNGVSGGMKTDILRFAVSGTNVVYTGTGTVDGEPINQYSMDEYKGYFRIATTDWGVGTYVTVLSANDMKTAGRTEPLAPNELMRSMRFMEEIGYVVTFENTDPLFTIDLSDPHSPKVLGELKIPGFSQYLHPVGDGLLLGIGRDTQEIFTRDANGKETVIGFRDVGLKASLFDVSDLYNPIEVNVLSLGEGWAEVSYNPRALMADSKHGIYGFIMETWSSDIMDGFKNGSNAILLQAENGKLSVAAAINMSNTRANGRICYIGNTLYIVHNEGIDAYDYNTYEKLNSVIY